MKKLLATGSMLAYLAWFNASGGIAAAASTPSIAANDIQGPKAHQSARHAKHSEEKIARLADKFGLDADVLQQDLKSNMSIKQILQKHGITKNQLREMTGKKHR